MLALHVRLEGLDQIAAEFDALPAQIQRASAHAVRQTVNEVARQAEREIAEQHAIPLRAIRRRRVLTRTIDAAAGVVWIGYNPIPAAYVGRLSQHDFGAAAGSFLFPGGFLARMASGHLGIYRRQGRERLPITEQRVALTRTPAILGGLQRTAVIRLGDLLRQALQNETRLSAP